MNLKQRVSVNVSLTVSFFIGVAFIVIYLLFSTFRKEDFYDRLERKARSTARLLLDIKEIDQSLLYRIEKDTPYKMWMECIVVEDSNQRILFSSLPDYSWLKSANIHAVQQNNPKIEIKYGKKEIVGLRVDQGGGKYFVYIAAEDKFGNGKLLYLKYILIITFVVVLIILFASTSKLVRKLLSPLDKLNQDISFINTKNLHEPISDNGKNDEIGLLTQAFNDMLSRIDVGYKAQVSFTAHASHELRTPISRILFQLENLLQLKDHPESTREYLNKIKRDAFQMSDLISSLLTLARIEREEIEQSIILRLDEIIFEAYEQNAQDFPALKISFDISSPNAVLELYGSRSLMLIAFSNLFRNASLYSTNQKVDVDLRMDGNYLQIIFQNEASVAQDVLPDDLLKPFVRGKNNGGISGSGLGLGIVNRIVAYHSGSVKYRIEDKSQHILEIRLPVMMDRS